MNTIPATDRKSWLPTTTTNKIAASKAHLHPSGVSRVEAAVEDDRVIDMRRAGPGEVECGRAQGGATAGGAQVRATQVRVDQKRQVGRVHGAGEVLTVHGSQVVVALLSRLWNAGETTFSIHRVFGSGVAPVFVICYVMSG